MAQANGPAQAQVQQPAHPIHQETAIHEQLTRIVAETPENDPHEGTDMEEPKAPPAEEPKAEAAEKQEPAAEEATIEFDEETPFFELDYNGKKEKLSAKQLREGYLAKQDYHRNIQKVKQEQAQVAEQVKIAELKAQQDYLTKLETQKQLVLKTVAPELQNVDLNKLSMEDPAEAQRLFFRQIQMNQTLQAIEAEQRQAHEKMQSDHKAALEAAIKQARETLESDIPGWSEEKYQQVLSTVSKDYGFKGDDVAQVYDARLIKVFHDAYQYRQLQKAKPEVSKKVVAVPKVVKPGSAEKPNTSSTAIDDAAQRLKKSGRGEDFVEWYAANLKQQKRK